MIRAWIRTALVIFAAGMTPLSASGPPLSITSYSASADGFLSNSYLIAGKQQAILIDAQFIPAQAENAAGLVVASGKTLTGIVITHPHPDHYYGLELLGRRFADAAILGGRVTIEEINKTRKYWPGAQTDFAEPRPLPASAGSFKLGQSEILFRTWRDVESVENTVLYIPSMQVLFIGDLASNGVHMWLAEGRLENWLARLEEVLLLGPVARVFPGHGPEGDVSLIETARQYIIDFREAVGNATTPQKAIEQMKSLYPQHKLPQILEGSVYTVMKRRN